MAASKASVTVKVVSNKLPSIPPHLKNGAQTAVKTAGFQIEAAGKEKAPVRTGTLRRSIHTVLSNDDMTATVGPSVEYGLYVEMGTRHMAARPYMRPAAELVLPKFAEAIKALLRGLP
jgi:HK97 gp10 family phage protein